MRTSGDSRIERPRGVRSASRSCADATADAAGDRPGRVNAHTRRIGTCLLEVVAPGDSSTLPKVYAPRTVRRMAVTARTPTARDAPVRFDCAALRVAPA